ncbi:hypothetical protein K493DRAFT_302639 [Basidiobolus meristosporus CBS 931.73]|uniref:N-acyl amino acid synthase FeeM catalytic core domain-containing protein n=1 Tax=Basidiobolus meristosporus CBS 931.73 TaxID=1314790 RepID=A0A1Y1Y641_9FUNG|nr:hypothetical protein K493DRAFT_302639 [Basidiobolus meristosporus CBS 931.73]|eukprot:ORX93482.1 hypothetical protein K493DRAFT_302639 [Basidiobolus meristosporus CBS 931.73]
MVYQIRIVKDEEGINQIQRLLYTVYIEEGKWKFNPANPAGLRIENHRLTDNRDDIATYFGAFSNKKLIGCCRICPRHEGLFEIQNYNSKTLSLLTEKNLVEGSRSAVLPEYRQHGVFHIMFHEVLQYCYQRDLLLFVCTSSNELQRIFRIIDFPMVEDFTFRYESHDPKECQLFVAKSRSDLLNSISKLRPTVPLQSHL